MVDISGGIQASAGQIIQVGVDHLQEEVESGKLSAEALQARLTRRFGDAANGAFGEDGSVDFDAVRALFEGQQIDASAAASGSAEAANPTQLVQLLAERLGVTEPDILDESGSISQEKMNLLLDQLRSDPTGLWDAAGSSFDVLA